MRWSILLLMLSAAGPALAIPAPRESVWSVRVDERDCAWPTCGGWFASRVNHERMVCLDGTVADECYVLSIDWSAMGLTPEQEAEVVAAASAGTALVRATPAPIREPGFGWFTELRATGAWTSWP